MLLELERAIIDELNKEFTELNVTVNIYAKPELRLGTVSSEKLENPVILVECDRGEFETNLRSNTVEMVFDWKLTISAPKSFMYVALDRVIFAFSGLYMDTPYKPQFSVKRFEFIDGRGDDRHQTVEVLLSAVVNSTILRNNKSDVFPYLI